MPSIYYKKEFEIDNGKKVGIIFADTSTLLCSNFTYITEGHGREWDPAFPRPHCSKEETDQGNA